MTRLEYAKQHLPEFEELLRATIRDWEDGTGWVRVRVSEDDFRPELERWFRRWMAKEYNALIAKLGATDPEGGFWKQSQTISIPSLAQLQ